MARRAAQPPPPPEPLHLLIPRADAAERIQRQIAEGNALLQALEAREDFEKLETRKREWRDYTKELLARSFSNRDLESEFNYSLATAVRIATWRDQSRGLDIRNFQESLRSGVDKLQSIQRRLELIPEPEPVASTGMRRESRPAADIGNTVFLVHGREETAKSGVARFLERLDLKVVILHEQPDKGRTVIEKFEHHADAVYAVVLMTPDDVGASAASPDALRPRPRQNVVFELGYFIGKLGRSNVCALVADGVELEMLSDFMGVLTIPLDAHGAWHLRLAREIKAAGLAVDLNRAV